MILSRLKKLREEENFTQSKIAEALHCSQQVYSNYELGQRDIPTDVLVSLSKFYGVSVDYILEITDNPEINR